MPTLMRLPHAKEKSDAALNAAYIFAATRNFNEASQMVIDGLHANGYEDIVVAGKAIEPPETIAHRRVKDTAIALPYMNVKSGAKFRRLDYVTDLIGSKSVLAGAPAAIPLAIVEQDNLVKIDIGAGGEIVRDASGKLNLIYHYKDFTKPDLLAWLGGKIRRSFVSRSEMNGFLSCTVNGLLSAHSIAALSVHRYAALEAIEREMDRIVGAAAEKQFDALAGKKLLAAKGESFAFPDEMELPSVSRDRFRNHLYDIAFKMNGEESSMASMIDGLPNIKWWFRNPELSGFYIQGPRKQRFYPDFIVKTKKRNYFAVEYKGEHLLGSDDTDYKESIGKQWATLAGGKYHFAMASSENTEAIVAAIAKA